jgi:hypothetical protein
LKYVFAFDHHFFTRKTKGLSFFKKLFKKTIILYCVDLYNPQYHKKWLIDKIGQKFNIKYDENNPDYLIYNVFGNDHLNTKYNNSIKIAIITENRYPDLIDADYALGFAHINYLDRYFKFPILTENTFNIKYVQNIRKTVLSNLRKKFCAAVISNYLDVNNMRIKFINELSKYKKVDMGGKYNNNIGGPVKNKIEFFSSYKFSIAMENNEGDGYTTEKIFQSFTSGTIPIYYGNYMIEEIFNPKSYILIKNERDMINKIEYIKKIDNDDEIYKNILKEEILVKSNIKRLLFEQKEFLWNIFQQEKEKAYRRFY